MIDPVTNMRLKRHQRRGHTRPGYPFRSGTPPRHEQVELIDDLQNLSGWHTQPDADTENFIAGTQGGKITSTSGSEVSRALFTPGLSLLAKTLKFWLYVEDLDKLDYVRVRAYEGPASGGHRGWFVTALSTGWNEVQLVIGNDNFGSSNLLTAEGRISLARSVGSLYFFVKAKAGETTSVTLDMITAVESPLEHGLIAFGFDDHWESVPLRAGPVFAQLGVPATFYVGTTHIDNGPGHATWEQLKHLQRQGWVIASHTHRELNLNSQALADARVDIRDGQRALIQRGYSPRTLAYPHGRANADVRALTAEYHEAGRTTGNYIFPLPLPDDNNRTAGLPALSNYWIPSFDLIESSLNAFKELVKVCAAMRMAMTTYSHDVSVGPSGFTAELLREAVEAAMDAGLEVVTMDDLLDINPSTSYRRTPGGAALSADEVLSLGLIAGGAEVSSTFNVDGVREGDVVSVSPPANVPAGLIWFAFVSDLHTVTLRVRNMTSGGITPPSGNWRVRVTPS